MDDITFENLEQKVDNLIQQFSQIEAQNNSLQENELEWKLERNQLIQKIELARNKIESMISRLKALEQDA